MSVFEQPKFVKSTRPGVWCCVACSVETTMPVTHRCSPALRKSGTNIDDLRAQLPGIRERIQDGMVHHDDPADLLRLVDALLPLADAEIEYEETFCAALRAYGNSMWNGDQCGPEWDNVVRLYNAAQRR